jgi:KaiC/GvpD/RAD55 family RecA-like ATPase
MYAFTVPGTGVAEPLSPGSLLLVTGPSTDAKRRFTASVAAAGHAAGDRALLVTTDEGPGTTLRRFRTQTRRAGVLDAGRFAVVASERAAPDDASPPTDSERAGRVQRFPGPAAFAALGSALSDAFEATAETDRYWLVLDSLSDIVDGAEAPQAYKFCHVLAERLAETGGVGVLALDDGHGSEAVGLLRQVTDGVVRTRPAAELAGGDCEFRIAGAGTGWRLVETRPGRDENADPGRQPRERLEGP